MKKLTKKILSVVLCLSVILCTCAVAVSTSATDYASGTDIPLIYVVGTGAHLIADNPDGTTRKIFPLQLPKTSLWTRLRKILTFSQRLFLLRSGTNSAMLLTEL